MEASCAIIRIVQNFPRLALPPGVAREPVGMERQTLTIVLSSADGCKVIL
jgi:hypothetical protein